MLLQEEAEQTYSPLDLVPQSLTVRLKMMCLHIAQGNAVMMKQLYEHTPFDEVYEMMALLKSYHYRPNANI